MVFGALGFVGFERCGPHRIHGTIDYENPHAFGEKMATFEQGEMDVG